jgi:hypothetical protein
MVCPKMQILFYSLASNLSIALLAFSKTKSSSISRWPSTASYQLLISTYLLLITLTFYTLIIIHFFPLLDYMHICTLIQIAPSFRNCIPLHTQL